MAKRKLWQVCGECSRNYPLTEEFYKWTRHQQQRVWDTFCRWCRDKANEKEEENRILEEERYWVRIPKTEVFTAEGLRPSPTHKGCVTCGESYSLTERNFFPNGKNPDGFGNQCRECFIASRPLPKRRKIAYAGERRPNTLRRKVKYAGERRPNTLRLDDSKFRRSKLFTKADWQRALDYFGGVCAVCGRPPGLWHKIVRDHWRPVAKAGPLRPDNVIPLCHAIEDGQGGCNNSKSSKDAETWLVERYGKRKAAQILRRITDYFASLT